MTKLFILSAFIAGIAVGQSEPRGVGSPQERDVSVPVVQDARKPLSGTTKQKWGGISPRKRDQAGHGRTEEDGLSVSERASPHVTHIQTLTTPSESEYLKEIATMLSIPVSKDDTPGDIAFKIKQCIGHAERYRGEVLSEESFAECCAAIPTIKDTETFKAYHAFIKKVEGKRIMILECKE